MDIEVTIEGESLSITVENPFHMETAGVVARIREFADKKGLQLEGLNLEGLLPKMIRGVVGCEEGCPANAKSLVAQGYGDFHLEYIEGGILAASCQVNGSERLTIKVFPEF
ncbi:hypothetical protein BMS3Bbin07_00913 [bacterium BMS3Bbin07]|nr:hypothetical protein BMS3Bbin07_00913 [bacterium BMS3Bbin07]